MEPVKATPAILEIGLYRILKPVTHRHGTHRPGDLVEMTHDVAVILMSRRCIEPVAAGKEI